MSFTQDFFTSRRNYGDGATRIERPGVLWYHSDDNTIRVGDGVTPGGIILTGGGGGNQILPGNLTINGNLTVNGDTQLGNSAGDTINIFGRLDGDLIPSQNNLFDIGKPDLQWRNVNAAQFFNGNILIDDNVIQTTNSNSDLELRVNGNGTVNVNNARISNLATPVDATDAVTKAYVDSIVASPSAVANVLYVSKSGSDTQNGTSLNTSKLTIKSAVAAASYGTTIFVKSGDYTELNPIIVPEGVSIVGDNLRSVTVRPYYKTQDLFWVSNAVYLAHMTFKDHEYPSAAVAFPTDGSAGAIHTSPYVQNCTSMTTTGTGLRIDGAHSQGLKSFVVDAYTQYNQGGIGIHMKNRGNAQLVSVFTICCDTAILAESGGFCSLTNSNSSFGNVGLKADGLSSALYTAKTNGAALGSTILIDNLTQIPNVGDAFKFAGDTTVYEVLSTNGIHPLNDGISAIQGPDYTPQPAQAKNIRSNVLDYKTKIQIDTIDFLNETYIDLNYNNFKCSRDVGIIIDAVLDDMVFGTNYKSILAGLSYYRASASVVINDQLTETVSAINFAKTKVLEIIATPGAEYTAVSNNFDTIISILQGNPAPVLVYNNPIGVTIGKSNAKQILQTNKEFLVAEGIAYISANYPTLTYNQSKCEADIRFMVNAITYDLLYEGNSQTVDAGDEYYSGGTLQIPAGERAATAATFAYLKTVAAQCLVNTVVTALQNTVVQNTSSAAATGAEVTVSNALFDIVINLVENAYTSQIEVYPRIINTMADNTTISFHQFSKITASNQTFEWVGAGVNVNTALPYQGGVAVQVNEVVELNGGKVNFTSTDQEGDFRIGEDLVINRRLGTISGRTFTRSLFAIVTPYILAIGE